SISCKRCCNSVASAQVPGSAQRLPVPCERSTTPLSCGRRGGLAVVAMAKPSNHKARSVGRSPDEPHGVPLSTRKHHGRPQRRKVCRSTAWTSSTGTVFQKARGENRGLEDGAAAFIHEAQPAGLAAVAQGHLIGRIHLPHGVGPLRPRRRGADAAARGGRRQ